MDHLGHVQPARFLPQLERALFAAVAPAHGEVYVARGVGNGVQVHGRVMHLVTQYRPNKLTLRTRAVAQQLQALCRRFFQHTAIHFIALLACGHVLVGREVVAQNIAAYFLEEARFGFLAQVAFFDQLGDHRRGGKVGVERVGIY